MSSHEKLRCPSCGGNDTRHSVRRGIIDAVMKAFHRRAYRCRSCRRRFFGPEDDRIPEELETDDKPADKADQNVS